MEHMSLPIVLDINITEIAERYLYEEKSFDYDPITNCKEMFETMIWYYQTLVDDLNLTIDSKYLLPSVQNGIASRIFKEYKRLKKEQKD